MWENLKTSHATVGYMQRHTCQELVTVVKSQVDKGLNKYWSHLSHEGRLVCLDVVKEKLAWPSWYSCSELPQGYVHCQVVWSEFCPGRSYNPDVGTHFQIFSCSVLLGFSFNWWAVTSHHLLTWLNTTLMSSVDLTPYMMAVINQALQAKDPFSLQVCSSQTTH